MTPEKNKVDAFSEMFRVLAWEKRKHFNKSKLFN